MKMNVVWIGVMAFFVGLSPAMAQGLSLAWDHDGLNVDYFTVSIDAQPQYAVGLPSPYVVPLPTLSAGTHTFVVEACNAIGCTASGAIAFTVPEPAPEPDPEPPPPPPADTTAPDVSVRVTRSGNSSNFTVTATTTATDVVQATFYLDGRAVAWLTSAPYSLKLSISSRGSHLIAVVLQDAAGNQGSAAVAVYR